VDQRHSRAPFRVIYLHEPGKPLTFICARIKSRYIGNGHPKIGNPCIMGIQTLLLGI